jgi:hypothetical protein
LVVHQTDPYTPWGVGVLRYHRIPPLAHNKNGYAA